MQKSQTSFAPLIHVLVFAAFGANVLFVRHLARVEAAIACASRVISNARVARHQVRVLVTWLILVQKTTQTTFVSANFTCQKVARVVRSGARERYRHGQDLEATSQPRPWGRDVAYFWNLAPQGWKFRGQKTTPNLGSENDPNFGVGK